MKKDPGNFRYKVKPLFPVTERLMRCDEIILHQVMDS
jgi:hypothetical protein